MPKRKHSAVSQIPSLLRAAAATDGSITVGRLAQIAFCSYEHALRQLKKLHATGLVERRTIHSWIDRNGNTRRGTKHEYFLKES